MIKSWDIFDTLIARKFVSPRSVFEIVEQISKIKNFMAIRIAAEQNLVRQGLNYNIEDIYKEFQRITNAPENLCDSLKNLEVKVELDQCIPITENLRQVKAGDILISDMYLPEKVIRDMLEKVGLFVPIEIVITSGGKASGKVWKEFSEQGKFLFHMGDNKSSDINQPRKYGFESALPVSSQPNIFEQWLMQRDFQFGAYLREIRLRNPFTEEIKRTYWTLFTMNVGILIILVQLIDKLQKRYGFEYLGFCGRDTYFMRLLYQKYKKDRNEIPADNDYLYYSRKLVRYAAADIGKYFSSRIAGRKALMIDLTGTGVHLNNLRINENLNYAILIALLIKRNDNTDFVKKLYPNEKSYPEDWIYFDDAGSDSDVYFKNFTFFDGGNQNMEFINRAPHNTPIRLNAFQIGEKIIPDVIFSEINDAENYDVIETCFKEAVNSKIIWCSESPALIETLKGLLKIFLDISHNRLLCDSHSRNI